MPVNDDEVAVLLLLEFEDEPFDEVEEPEEPEELDAAGVLEDDAVVGGVGLKV